MQGDLVEDLVPGGLAVPDKNDGDLPRAVYALVESFTAAKKM